MNFFLGRLQHTNVLSGFNLVLQRTRDSLSHRFSKEKYSEMNFQFMTVWRLCQKNPVPKPKGEEAGDENILTCNRCRWTRSRIVPEKGDIRYLEAAVHWDDSVEFLRVTTEIWRRN